jgi:hypothetical protein
MRDTTRGRSWKKRVEWAGFHIDQVSVGIDARQLESQFILPQYASVCQSSGYVSWHDYEYEYRPVTSVCLRSFIQLAHAPDQSILEFAKNYGILGEVIDETDTWQPPSDPLEMTWWLLGIPGKDDYAPAIDPDVACGMIRGGREPIRMWRYYAAQLRAILCIAADHSCGEKTSIQDWEALLPRYPPHRLRSVWEAGVEEQRGVLTCLLYGWFRDLEAHPRIRYENGVPRLTFGLGANSKRNPAVQYALALQVLAILAHPDGVYRCSVCKSPFLRDHDKNKPRVDRKRFCSEECRDEAVREKSRLWQRKNRAAQRTGENPILAPVDSR